MTPVLELAFSQPAGPVEVFDFVEIELRVAGELPANPFTGAALSGEFQLPGAQRVRVEGFCDSSDGALHRIRFMPQAAGTYDYRLDYRQGDFQRVQRGRFTAVAGARKGLVRVDPANPYHFLWTGSGEHFFWNATTTYAVLGWDDETLDGIVDRLARLQVNRLRVGLASARVESGRAWFEEVFPSERFTFLLNPWVAERPNSVEDPGFDTQRFNLPFWHKVERLLRRARERDVQISIVFYVDGARPGVDPFKGKFWGEEELYYSYTINRLAAFANVMWDITNEWRLFRSEAWVNWMGNFIKTYDPYQHLTSCHGHEVFPFLAEHWADFSMYQLWDETGGNAGLLQRRALQALSGKPKPVVNEEYGYEDHYPSWGSRTAPARSTDNRRRLAWEMSMAGCYQTTGERAVPHGGWINGLGADDTLFTLHGHMLKFFTGFEWWKMTPHNELANLPNLCLAEPGRQYAAYLPAGGRVTLSLAPGNYRVAWFNPRTGEQIAVQVEGSLAPPVTPLQPDPATAYIYLPAPTRAELTAYAPNDAASMPGDDWAFKVER